MSATYRLSPGDALVLRVDDGPWQTVPFSPGDIADPGRATSEEVAKVVDARPGLAAEVDADGRLVLATEAAGGHVSLEVDPTSPAAAALGLVAGRTTATGTGLVAARVVGSTTEPFALRRGARMKVVVDGRRRRVAFAGGFTAGRASADDVAGVINAKLGKPLALARGDGRIALTSPTVGLPSSMAVEGDGGEGIQDAAAALGFVGPAAESRPYRVDPARLVCAPVSDHFAAVNLTAAPIELHLSSGTTILPARASIPLRGDGSGEGQLQRLVEQGAVHVVPAAGPAAPQPKGEAVDAS